jgi:hypothetical protein
MRNLYAPLLALPLSFLGLVSGACSGSVAEGGSAGAASGGSASSGAASVGGSAAGSQSATGGTPSATGGASAAQAGTGGAAAGAAGSGSGGMGGTGGSGGADVGGSAGSGGVATCTASKATGDKASGTGPHEVVIETNPEDGIECGTIYRPQDLEGAEKYPIFVWGEGACEQNGLSNRAALAEIASWGYFIVADGTPGGQNACQGGQNGKALLDYVTWAIAENSKPCSAYYQSLEPTKIAADGFSCGGLMAMNVSGDSRFTAIGITSSGLMSPNDALYDAIHTPFKIMNGANSQEIAYSNGVRDYEEISSRGKPILYLAKKSAGHGGDLGQGRGDFNRVNLAWLNWQLKGDQGATGKGFLQGASCQFCSDSGWEYEAANLN